MKNASHTVKMIDNSYATWNEDENVILMLSSKSQEDGGTVEISSMMATQKRRLPPSVVWVNNKNVKFLADSGSPLTLIIMADFKDTDDMVVQESRLKKLHMEKNALKLSENSKQL
ncbi:hypothetical protein NDU88_002661 [Pleurodeles waltl]|uniref:Uncharacterized protein n=1 Tax=Pleurodeles waltl TaxID=8319 RepID=A0AAV7LPV9_PLEWA|nr:hypothetical protein NDU88_002661 [Pleurodeles waltl]